MGGALIPDELFSSYLEAWGRRMLWDRPASGLDLVIVDGFAGRGNAPAIIRAMDAIAAEAATEAPPRVGVVLVEADPRAREEVIRALDEAGFGGRVRERADPGARVAGEIVVLGGRFDEVVKGVARVAEAAAGALFLLNPPGAAALPLAAVERIAGHSDALIRFPREDFQAQSRFRGSLADLPPRAKRLVGGCSALFGDRRDEWVYLWREAERSGGDPLDRMAARYRERLAATALEGVVRRVTIGEENGEGREELFLSARDPLRALLLNRVLSAAGLAERVQWAHGPFRESVPVEEPPDGVLELFSPEEVVRPPGEAERKLNEPRLAERLAEHFGGRVVPLREVQRFLADTDVFPDEVPRVLRFLKRSGGATYRSLARDDAPITFLARPASPGPPGEDRH